MRPDAHRRRRARAGDPCEWPDCPLVVRSNRRNHPRRRLRQPPDRDDLRRNVHERRAIRRRAAFSARQHGHRRKLPRSDAELDVLRVDSHQRRRQRRRRARHGGVDRRFRKGEFQTYGRSSRVYWHFGYWVDPTAKYVHYECLCYDTGRWVHATVVRDAEANVVNFYKDGVLDRSDPSPPPILPGTSMLLMGRWQQAGRLFAGSLDDVAIYQRALSAAEVAELHQHPPARPQ
jgi:hypothetical protein